MRSPICCVLGHVDAGKTSLLDCMRRTAGQTWKQVGTATSIQQRSVQLGEAGGITQQIGATYFPSETIKDRMVDKTEANLDSNNIPGLLIMDTPGHEAFSNLRINGSQISDIAILVVDITHGLQPQTIESIKLLRANRTPFIVVLNQVDRISGWKSEEDNKHIMMDTILAGQSSTVNTLFRTRINHFIVEFSNELLNVALYWENTNMGKQISMVPVSAKTGEGIRDLFYLVNRLSINYLKKKLDGDTTFKCSILEVKQEEGLGGTLDAILINGKLSVGDRVIAHTIQGLMPTTIKSILLPPACTEMRVKTKWTLVQNVVGAMGIKIIPSSNKNSGFDTSDILPGTELLMVPETIKDDAELQQYLENLELEEGDNDKAKCQDITDRLEPIGLYIQSSTMGSLIALMNHLQREKIPVSDYGLGPLSKKDLQRVKIHTGKNRCYNTVLVFDPIKVAYKADPKEFPEIHVIGGDILYGLVDKFKEYQLAIFRRDKEAAQSKLEWPVILLHLPFVFNMKDPIVIGCRVEEGTLKIGTTLCVLPKVAAQLRLDSRSESLPKKLEAPRGEPIILGKVTSIEKNKKALTEARVGNEVAVKIEGSNYVHGRHFDKGDYLVSYQTRESLDIIKEHFREDLTDADKKLLFKLKGLLNIC